MMKIFLIIWSSCGVLFYIWRLTKLIKDGVLDDVWKNGDRVKVIFEYFITAIPLSIIVWPHEVYFWLKVYYRYKHHPEERTDYKNFKYGIYDGKECGQ